MIIIHKSFPLNNLDLIILLAILARFTSPITADFSYLILGFISFYGRKQVIKALLLSWLFTMCNSNIFPNANFGNIGQYFVILSAFTSMVFRFNFQKIDSFFLLTLGLGVFFFFHAISLSQIRDVSILKSINWTLVILTLLMAWSGLSSHQHEQMYKWMIKLLLLVAIISLPTLFFSNIGYARTDDGFQGILGHPMVFGPTMALLCALLFGNLLKETKISFKLLFILISIFILTVISDSRTAVISLVFGFILSLILNFFISKKKIRLIAPGLFGKRFILILLLFIALLIFDSMTFNLVEYFIAKSGKVNVDSLFEAYKVSRGSLYEPMLNNIKENPFTGLGFGVASDPQSMFIKRDPFFNLPISAPVEKGIVPLMVLEEVGIFGFILFSIWIFIIIHRAIGLGFTSLILLSTLLLLNLAEGTLFSPGGMGLLNLILLTSVTSKSRLLKPEMSKKKINDRI